MKFSNIRNWRGLALLLPTLLLVTSLFAQKETETVEKYRVVYEYKAPEIVGGDTEGASTNIRPTVSPDSIGVYYNYDNDLARLIELHKGANERTTEGPGFRIQIYAGSKMETANEAKADFLQSFRTTHMEAYKDWHPPHFWVRVGDFLSRNEAMKQLPNIKKVFPDAFVVSDKINLPRYKKPSAHHHNKETEDPSPKDPQN